MSGLHQVTSLVQLGSTPVSPTLSLIVGTEAVGMRLNERDDFKALGFEPIAG